MLAIPLTLAIIGLIGTGVFAEIDHGKNLELKRDLQRQEDVLVIQDKLSAFYREQQAYPVQKDQSFNGEVVLEEVLGEVPSDPVEKNSYWYWSDGQSYTLRYLTEETKEEVVIFSQ